MTNWNVQEYDILPYDEALSLQMDAWNNVSNGAKHVLMLLEHEPVITMGRRTDAAHLLMSESELNNLGIKLFKVDRGGSATYHGPGQLVGYVIAKASRHGGIHQLVSKLLDIIHSVMLDFGVDCLVDHDNPGIWTISDPPRKIAALGMQNKEGYTLHGFAINVHLPLTGFSAIVPCGLTLPVSTMSIETGRILKVEDVKSAIKEKIQNELQYTIKLQSIA